jgi:Uma2 family endonuclease
MPLPKEHICTSEDYWNLPEGQRAELIDGKLYAMVPPSFTHQKISFSLSRKIADYIDHNKGNCEVIPAPFAVNLDASDKTWVEPDISVICDKTKISEKGCNGAPDWVIEVVSPSTQSRDYLKKLWLYQNTGVREYWIINPITQNVQVYSFGDEESSNQFSFNDEISSHIFSALTVKISDLL